MTLKHAVVVLAWSGMLWSCSTPAEPAALCFHHRAFLAFLSHTFSMLSGSLLLEKSFVVKYNYAKALSCCFIPCEVKSEKFLIPVVFYMKENLWVTQKALRLWRKIFSMITRSACPVQHVLDMGKGLKSLDCVCRHWCGRSALCPQLWVCCQMQPPLTFIPGFV